MSEPKSGRDLSSREVFHLHFVKSAHDLDAKTLGTAILETAAVLDEITRHNNAHYMLGMRVLPFKKGSFEIPVEIYPILAGTMECTPEMGPVVKLLISRGGEWRLSGLDFLRHGGAVRKGC